MNGNSEMLVLVGMLFGGLAVAEWWVNRARTSNRQMRKIVQSASWHEMRVANKKWGFSKPQQSIYSGISPDEPVF